VLGVNHAVLKVRVLDRSVAFYRDVLGLTEIARAFGQMAFLRAPGSDNHHDLGLLELGASAPPAVERAAGLYHLAWQVADIGELADVRKRLAERGALTGQSDHGATKSLYGIDPDGNEFEVMWLVPREAWGEWEDQADTLPLDLEREIARWSGKGVAAATPLAQSSARA